MLSKNILFKYRSDIDGLRAIAVFSVIIFHVWPDSIRGGFVGVDIFFVISGYIITSLIHNKLESKEFSLLDFYARRVKRIMPMCWLIISLCYLFSILILLPNDLINFSGSARAASLYLTNVFFIKNNNYFALSSNELPLLHFWSLAVEEQFYIFYPFILIFIYRFINDKVKISFLCLSTIFIISLFASIYCGYSGYSNLAYYSIFTRAFELSFGSLIFYSNIYIIRNTRFPNNLFLANLISMIGFLLIILSILFIDERVIFPGYIALFPIVGAGLIVLSGSINKATFIYRLLSVKILVFVGLISYSLYLWHWPILAFWRYEFPSQHLSLCSGVFIIVITIFVSAITYKFFESPIRHSKISLLKTLIFLQIIPIIILSISREYIIKNNGLPSRMKSISVSSSSILSEQTHDIANVYTDNGYTVGGYISRKSPKLLLVGDSHATQYKPFWNYLGIKWGFNIVFMDYKGCHALISRKNDQSIENHTNSDECRNLIRDFTKYYKNYDVVVMAGRWGADLGDESSIISGQKLNLISGFTYESDYDRTIRELTADGKKIIIMGDSPNDRTSAIDTYYRHQFLGRYSFFQKHLQDEELKFNFYDNHATNSIMRSFSSRYPNVYYFDFNKDVLSHVSTFPFLDGRLLYLDFNHLSQDGSLNLAESFVTFDSSKALWNKLHEFGIIQHDK